MSKHQNNTNALLVEIMIAVLFFSLCATVILNLLVGVREQSMRCDLTTAAMAEARNAAELLNVADHPAEALRTLGYAPDETAEQTETARETWTRTADGYLLRARLWDEPAEAGVLRRGCVEALRLPLQADAVPLLTLETAHFQAEVE